MQVVLNALDNKNFLSCVNSLNRPEARVHFAEELTLFSKCAIDISDGLVADLGHIVSASFCGANIKLEDIPLSSATRHYFDFYHKSSIDWSMVLTQGDDYELCFTVNKENESAVMVLAKKHQLKVSCIGEVTESAELVFHDDNNELIQFKNTGFKHFK